MSEEYPTTAYFDPTIPMPRQERSWSCSACSLAWLNRAMQIGRGTDESSAIDLIGYPQHINEQWGLSEGNGRRLAELLREDRGAAWNQWVDFETARQLADEHAMLLGGVGWYHWVGVRGLTAEGLWIANSAEGWKGVYEELSELQFITLGPFAAVIVPVHWDFPPSAET